MFSYPCFTRSIRISLVCFRLAAFGVLLTFLPSLPRFSHSQTDREMMIQHPSFAGKTVVKCNA